MRRFDFPYYVRICAISLLLLVGVSSCDPAHAQAVKVVPIETHTAEPGMSLDDFAKSIRKRVSRLGHRESAEVCGAFYQRGGVYGVELVTSGRDMECVMDTPADFTGVTIHTHPVTSPGLFSEHDYNAGEGYLVLKGVLYHQRGKGTARRVL